MLLGQILDRAVRRFPDKTGLISGEREFTFRQMGDRANRLAHALLDMGLGKGDRVATLMPDIPEFHETFFAVAKAGLVLVPLNYRYLSDELIYAINNIEASALVFDRRYEEQLAAIKGALPSVKHFITVGEADAPVGYERLIASYSPQSPQVDITPDDLALIIYTSSMAVRPRAVMHTHRSVYTFVLACGPLLHVRPEQDICLVASPPYLLAAAPKVLATAYYFDTAVIMESFDPVLFMQMVEKHRVTNVFSPLMLPMLRGLLDNPDFGKYDLSSLRSVFIGVNAVPPALAERAVKAFGPRVFCLYGSTEGGAVMTLMELGEMRDDLPPEKARILKSCGREPNWLDGEIRIINEAGEDVACGEVGEIIQRGDGIMKGYRGLAEETAKVIDSDGWYHSGDMAAIDEDGYIFVTGSKSGIIRSGGENISPAEVEGVISRHPAVSEVMVVGAADAYWGEAVKALVVLKAGAKAGEQEIIDFCRQHLASFKKPKSVVFITALPVGMAGADITDI